MKIFGTSELRKVLGGSVIRDGGGSENLLTSVNLLSSNVSEGSLYIPVLAGARSAPVLRALRNGAAAVLVDKWHPDFSGYPLANVIQVRDLAEAMEALSAYGRGRMSGPVVGVTGSVGKTSTKSMLAHVLRHMGDCVETVDGFNVNYGLHVCLASLTRNTDFAVVEIAGSGPGQMKRLAPIVAPDVGIVTSIGSAHGKNFSDPYEVLRGKSEIFRDVDVAIVPLDILKWDDSKEGLIRRYGNKRLITVSDVKGAVADVRIVEATMHATYSDVVVEAFGQSYAYSIGSPGGHLVKNSLLVVAALLGLWIDPAGVMSALSTWKTVSGRGERYRLGLKGHGECEFIEDSYNASPESVQALLDLIGMRSPRGRKIFVFGDMLELGEREVALHENMAAPIGSSGVDVLVSVGPLAKRTAEMLRGKLEVHVMNSVEAVGELLPCILRDGDLVAIKGSNGMKLGQIPKIISSSVDSFAKVGSNWSVDNE